jgi:hypothetical protein
MPNEKNCSDYYLFWYGEIDVVYVIGFNDRNEVVSQVNRFRD